MCVVHCDVGAVVEAALPTVDTVEVHVRVDSAARCVGVSMSVESRVVGAGVASAFHLYVADDY